MVNLIEKKTKEITLTIINSQMYANIYFFYFFMPLVVIQANITIVAYML